MRIFAYILLLNYLTIIFRPAIPLLDYFTHLQQYEETCENKDKPEMHCNGQCHLAKKMKTLADEQAPNKKKSTLPQTKFKEFTIYYRKNLILKFYRKLTFNTCKSLYISQKINKGHLSELLKPPQYVS